MGSNVYLNDDNDFYPDAPAKETEEFTDNILECLLSGGYKMINYKKIKKSNTYEYIKIHELVRVIFCSARFFLQNEGDNEGIISKRLCTCTNNIIRFRYLKFRKHNKRLCEALMKCFTDAISNTYFYNNFPITTVERGLYTDLCELISDSISKNVIITVYEINAIFKYYTLTTLTAENQNNS